MRSDCTAIRHSKLSVLGRTQAANLVRHADDNASDISFVLDSLLHDFEYIIVDAPALPASKTAQTLSPNVDGVLLVVVPNETDIGDICAARKTLVSAGAQLLGAIYNTILDHSATTLGHTPCSDPSN